MQAFLKASLITFITQKVISKLYISMIKTLAPILCLLVLSQTTQIATPPPLPNLVPSIKPQSLTFSNYTGEGVSSEMFTGIINFINAASGYYKSDVKNNILYIKTKLDQIYGDEDQNFFVYIQTEKDVKFSWYVFLTFEFVIAGLSNVNIINPGWSYLVFKNFVPAAALNYAFISPGQVGPGITTEISDFFTEIVNTYEPDGACQCDNQSVINLGNTLIKTYLRPFNVICDSAGVTSALVKAVDGVWGSLKPKNCYYTLSVKY